MDICIFGRYKGAREYTQSLDGWMAGEMCMLRSASTIWSKAFSAKNTAGKATKSVPSYFLILSLSKVVLDQSTAILACTRNCKILNRVLRKMVGHDMVNCDLAANALV